MQSRPHTQGCVTEKMVGEFCDRGWSHWPSFLTEQSLESARKAVEDFLSVEVSTLRGRDVNYSGSDVNSIHKMEVDPWVEDVLNSREMIAVASAFLQEPAEPRKSELFAKPAGVGLASPAHQDNYLFCVEGGRALTIWIALDRGGQENGGLFYLDGSHKAGLRKHEPSFAPGTSQRIPDSLLLDKNMLVIPSVEPGDALVHHSEVVHGSGTNTSGSSRRGWTLQYKAKAAAYDKTMLERYERELSMQLQARNQI